MGKRKIGLLVIAAGTLSILIFLMSGDQGIIELYKSHQDINNKNAEIKQLHHTIDSLTIELGKLSSDTVYLERMAREKLGMAKKNERIYKFVEEK